MFCKQTKKVDANRRRCRSRSIANRRHRCARLAACLPTNWTRAWGCLPTTSSPNCQKSCRTSSSLNFGFGLRTRATRRCSWVRGLAAARQMRFVRVRFLRCFASCWLQPLEQRQLQPQARRLPTACRRRRPKQRDFVF